MESLFTEIDEEFICENCGHKVPKLGYSCRNHCNKCLYSKHVDINPGDRKEECHGLLEPISMKLAPKKDMLLYTNAKNVEQLEKIKLRKMTTWI